MRAGHYYFILVLFGVKDSQSCLDFGVHGLCSCELLLCLFGHLLEIAHHFDFLFEGCHVDFDFDLFFLQLGVH